MLPTIAFVGPIAERGKPAKGGFEAANRRTIDLLAARNLRVLECPYPDASGTTLRKTLTYLRGYVAIAFQLYHARAQWQLLHITPLLRQFALPELLLCALARALGKRVLLDIRAGSFLRHYAMFSAPYRCCIDAITRTANAVGIEGQRYHAHFATQGVAQILHFPNFVTWDDTLKSLKKPKVSRPIKLVMFGRLVKEKGVETGIETLRLLEQQSPGQFTLTLIGGAGPAYLQHLQTLTKGLPVTFTGALPYPEARKLLTQSTIFLFPTTHGGEGHSNALTEAMAHGCVPICADNGFNAEIVADSGVILPKTASAAAYAAALANLTPETLDKLSLGARQRVQTTYTDTHVMDKLIAQYQAIA